MKFDALISDKNVCMQANFTLKKIITFKSYVKKRDVDKVKLYENKL